MWWYLAAQIPPHRDGRMGTATYMGNGHMGDRHMGNGHIDTGHKACLMPGVNNAFGMGCPHGRRNRDSVFRGRREQEVTEVSGVLAMGEA